MKIGILTWYKALNHGAVLQTYASCKMLEQMGVTPVVLDYYWNLDINTNKTTRLSRYIKKFSPRQVIWHIRVKNRQREKKRVFDSFVHQKLPIGAAYDKEMGLDAVYIGSDMVFDVSEGYNPFMYGVNVPTDFVFSYAASFGYTTMEKLDVYSHRDDIIKALKRFRSIGYRDQNTVNILRYFGINVPATECIDPVLAYGFETEISEWDSGKWKGKKYIVIYAYDSTMNEPETVKQIKEISISEGLKVISCGYYHKWCDQCIQASPEEFVEMIKYATYVITDTFHGTVFSTIMHKQFASIVRSNGFKLRYLLEQSGLSDRISDKEHSLKSVLHKMTDYNDFDEWLKRRRNESKTFIRDNVEAIR